MTSSKSRYSDAEPVTDGVVRIRVPVDSTRDHPVDELIHSMIRSVRAAYLAAVASGGRLLLALDAPEPPASLEGAALAAATVGLAKVLRIEGREHALAVDVVSTRPGTALDEAIGAVLDRVPADGGSVYQYDGALRRVAVGLGDGWYAAGPPADPGEVVGHLRHPDAESGWTEVTSLVQETAVFERRAAAHQAVTGMTGMTGGLAGLAGRVAVVTGGGHGLGRAYALSLARAGARVVVNDRAVVGGTPTAETVVREIEATGGTAIAHVGSIADQEAAQAAVRTAVDAFGRIDILVNNAGVVSGQTFDVEPDDEITRLLEVHVRGALYCTAYALPLMRRQGFGRIVNDSSSAGVFGLPTRPAYGAAKAAMVGVTEALITEEPHNIIANAFLPRARTGRIPPPASRSDAMTPALRARMTAEYVAPLIVALSDPAWTSSGETYTAMGGWFARVQAKAFDTI
jgi:NAD(P)-dependent dehydrogenase (short-subunit alcohol dehydrogenase family)